MKQNDIPPPVPPDLGDIRGDWDPNDDWFIVMLKLIFQAAIVIFCIAVLML